jgi:hypothetical protein
MSVETPIPHSIAGTEQELTLDSIIEHTSRFVTTEYASLTSSSNPVTWPVTPYQGVAGRTLDVATGLTYPLKAERARRNPKVALSFSYPAGSGLDNPAIVVVQGLATVRDRDLVATSGRYLQASADRFPDAFAGIPDFVLTRMDWYWTRMWVEVTPIHVRWWDGGDLSVAPRVWHAPEGTAAPESDPPPTGRGAGSWKTSAPPDWRRRAEGAIDRLGLPVLTTVDADGWPLPLRSTAAEPTDDGFDLVVPAGVNVVDGPAFVSFHTHDEVFDGQENIGLAGRAHMTDGVVHVRVDRALADWGISKSPVRSAVAMWRAGRALRPRLQTEAARRGVTLPRFDDLGFVRPTRR